MIKNGLFILFLATFALNTSAVEYKLSAGYQNHDADWETTNAEFDSQDFSDSGYNVAFVIKNNFGRDKNHFIGAGIDAHSILDERVIGYRAIDYEYKFNESWRLGGFFGAASIDSGLPQNGYYMGINGSYLFTDSLSVSIEIKHGNGLARDRLLADDPEGDPEINRPDIFLDYVATGILLNWHF